MTLREEFDDLKEELTVRLIDANVKSALDFPFKLYIDKNDEDFYFVKGSLARLATKKTAKSSWISRSFL